MDRVVGGYWRRTIVEIARSPRALCTATNTLRFFLTCTGPSECQGQEEQISAGSILPSVKTLRPLLSSGTLRSSLPAYLTGGYVQDMQSGAVLVSGLPIGRPARTPLVHGDLHSAERAMSAFDRSQSSAGYFRTAESAMTFGVMGELHPAKKLSRASIDNKQSLATA